MAKGSETLDTEVVRRLGCDPDFVVAPRYDNSLSRLEEQYPDGVPVNVAAAALGMTEDQFNGHYGRIVRKLRAKLEENSK